MSNSVQIHEKQLSLYFVLKDGLATKVGDRKHQDRASLSQEPVKKILKDLGLTEKEGEIYIFLAKHGVLKGGEIGKWTKTHRALIYRILKSLQRKGLVEPTLEAPARFTAVPFETILELEIKAKRNEAALIENTKQELLSHWKNISQTEVSPGHEKFVVIEGNRKIYPKISKMIKETKNQLSAVSSIQGLFRADQFGLFDTILTRPLRSKTQFRFLTDVTGQNLNSLKTLLKRMPKTKLNFKGRNPDFGLQLAPRMVIRDDEEVMVFITPKTGISVEGQDEVCLWTDCKELVLAFASIFEEQWCKASDIQDKLASSETGESPAHIIEDEESAKQKYMEILKSADNDIILMTSSRGLTDLWQNTPQINEAIRRGVSVRIMAPIIDENQDAAKQLAKQSQVRHIAMGDLGTTIIDGKHLFQFKDMQVDRDMSKALCLSNMYYSDDFEYVSKMKITMEDIWRNAPLPSYTPWEFSFGPNMRKTPPSSPNYSNINKTNGRVDTGETIIDDTNPNKIDVPSMEFVQNRMQDLIRSKEPAIAYGWSARGIIRLPSELKIPLMGIDVIHLDSQSAFGGGHFLIVHLWLETPPGYSFVPVALVVNRQGAMVMQRYYVGTPAAQNIVLIEPHQQLEVFRKGNVVFAGWTVNIALPSTGRNLGPSCLFFEGHGPTQHKTQTFSLPSGYTTTMDFNRTHAFITFMTQPVPYVGTGIQGQIVTDYVMKTEAP